MSFIQPEDYRPIKNKRNPLYGLSYEEVKIKSKMKLRIFFGFFINRLKSYVS